MIRFGIYAFLLAAAIGQAVPVMASDSAVVLMYHRFGETAHPSTNIRIKQFEAHLEELSREKYTVLPLPKIIAKLRTRQPLPNRTVGISIDDAFLSAYREAFPRLQEAGLPFTLFVATAPVDRNLSGFMDWDQIRKLRDAGVTIQGGLGVDRGRRAAIHEKSDEAEQEGGGS